MLKSLFCVVLCVSFIHDAYSQSISSDIITIIATPMTNKSLDTKEYNDLDISENCTQALDAFTEKVTNLTRCIVLNARPIRLCVNCEENFKATMETYNNLQKESSCHKFYFESDQIGIINQVYNQGRALWIQNSCQNCQDYINATLEFFNVSSELETCVKNYNGSSEEFNSTCDVCEELFVKMNNIYKGFVKRLTDDGNGGVCMDIVDKMNITRHIWTSENCLKFDANVGYPNIITAVLVGAMPVFFYMLSKNISIIEDVKLVRPKRKSFASLPSESISSE